MAAVLMEHVYGAAGDAASGRHRPDQAGRSARWFGGPGGRRIIAGYTTQGGLR